MASACYVYAIVQQGARLPSGLTGLGNAPLSIVPWRSLAAVISPFHPAELRPTPAYLLRHEEVVETLCQHAPALPVRFGTLLADEASLRCALAERYEVLVADLARVGSNVELGLTVLWSLPNTRDEETGSDLERFPGTAPGMMGSGPGTRYLLARWNRYRHEDALQARARTLSAQVRAALHPYLLESRQRILLTPRLVLREAYLVDPQHVDAVRGRLEELLHAHPDLRFLISGPWPPYTFVSAPGKQVEQQPGPELDKKNYEEAKT